MIDKHDGRPQEVARRIDPQQDMEKRQRLTWRRLKELMQKHYTLLWVSYNENLDDHLELIGQCMQSRNSDPLSEAVWEWYCDAEWNAVHEVVEELRNACLQQGFTDTQVTRFFSRYKEEIKEEIYSRDDSDVITTLIAHTDAIPIRVEMLSNNDCINSHWLESQNGYRYEHSYFGDMVDALNLNPRKVARIFTQHDIKCNGAFPDIPERNGKEQVSYEDFLQEVQNSCSGANLLTYIARIDLQELYAANFVLDKIIIPKDNVCGLFSAIYGGGSVMEMRLLQDVVLDLKIAANHGYRLTLDHEECSIKRVYGVFDSFFGSTLKLLPQISDQPSK